MEAVANLALWIAAGRSDNPGVAGKVFIIVGVILGLIALAALGFWLVSRFGRTKARSLDSHAHPPGEAGRAGKRRKP